MVRNNKDDGGYKGGVAKGACRFTFLKNFDGKYAEKGTEKSGHDHQDRHGHVFQFDGCFFQSLQDGKLLYKFGCHGHGGADGDSCDDGSHEGFKNIRAHAGDISHIVAHVIGDNARVPRVIFGNAGFHFAHQVGTHIRRLGVHTATHTGKKVQWNWRPWQSR